MNRFSRTHAPQLALAAALLAGLCSQAMGKTCELAIAANDQMQFDQPELKVGGDCSEVLLTLKHSGKLPAQAMGHNWVLTETATVRSVALAGMAAGPAQSYVKAGDERVIAFTPVIGGGDSTQVRFPTSRLKKGGDYSFFCSFPGHWSVMKGKLVFG